MKSYGDRNRLLAGGSAVASRSNTSAEISSTIRTQTELPLGGAMNTTRRDADLAPMSVSVGVPMPAFATR
jgi:hypothetical protein